MYALYANSFVILLNIVSSYENQYFLGLKLLLNRVMWRSELLYSKKAIGFNVNWKSFTNGRKNLDLLRFTKCNGKVRACSSNQQLLYSDDWVFLDYVSVLSGYLKLYSTNKRLTRNNYVMKFYFWFRNCFSNPKVHWTIRELLFTCHSFAVMPTLEVRGHSSFSNVNTNYERSFWSRSCRTAWWKTRFRNNAMPRPNPAITLFDVRFLTHLKRCKLRNVTQLRNK